MKRLSHSRYQEDNCTYEIFTNCLETLNYECDYFYPLSFHNASEFEKLDVNSSVVLIGTKDCFNTLTNGAEETTNNTIQYLEHVMLRMIKLHPTKIFVIFHEYMTPLSLTMFNETNVKSIMWSNTLNDYEERSGLKPVFTKNKKTNKVGISLNRQMREHRITLVSYLHGMDLQTHIHISAVHLDSKCDCNLMDMVSWDFSNNIMLRDTSIKGFQYICENLSTINNEEPYNLQRTPTTIEGARINIINFENKLRNLYENSYVELVTETLYNAPSGIVTEKFLNSVYGCNFPIILSTPGTVDFLRNMGFDMFDDVVDHEYDAVGSPAMRMEVAIKANAKLFLNKEQTILHWESLLSRFEKNIIVANNIYKWYKDRALSKLCKMKLI
jgi:hypothetical protein